MFQKRAREVVDYRISKSIEEKQMEDSEVISTKLEEHNKVITNYTLYTEIMQVAYASK